MNRNKKLVLFSLPFIVLGFVIFTQSTGMLKVVITTSFHGAYDNMTEMYDASELVVVGTIQSSRNVNEPNKVIKTEHEVLISDLLSGEHPSEIVRFLQIGGIDNLLFIAENPACPLLKRGQKVILFLDLRETGRYIIQGGSQGLFHVIDGSVYSIGEITGHILNPKLNTNGMPIEEYVNALHSIH